jgi:hypothetical protein
VPPVTHLRRVVGCVALLAAWACQLYLTALVVESEHLLTYPAIHIWNQHRAATVAPYTGQTQSNHTPQWEPIDLPEPPPPPPPPPPIQ